MLPPNCTSSESGSFSIALEGGNVVYDAKCDTKCETCTDSANNCTSCVLGEHRTNVLPDCDCELGYHDQNGL
jgi:hypothetical protein